MCSGHSPKCSCAWTHSALKTNLWGSFILQMRKWGSEMLSNSPKFTQPTCDSAGIVGRGVYQHAVKPPRLIILTALIRLPLVERKDSPRKTPVWEEIYTGWNLGANWEQKQGTVSQASWDLEWVTNKKQRLLCQLVGTIGTPASSSSPSSPASRAPCMWLWGPHRAHIYLIRWIPTS